MPHFEKTYRHGFSVRRAEGTSKGIDIVYWIDIVSTGKTSVWRNKRGK